MGTYFSPNATQDHLPDNKKNIGFPKNIYNAVGD